MLKSITYDLVDHSHVEIVNGPHKTFEKTAALFEGEYSPEIVRAVESLNVKPAHTYLLINALGAGEYYGSNKNNDYFPEIALKEYHKTFEALAHVYKHHVNKDPLRSYGKVIFSFYNEKMHRVELIVEIPNEKAPDIIERISKGEHVAVSMGARVPFDECSECHNKAKSRAEYCEHLQQGKAGRYHENGRKPYAINRHPKFFDISFVTIPADPTASVMAKVASLHNPMYVSSELEMDHIIKKSDIKRADLIKHIEGKVVASAPTAGELVVDTQPAMLKEELLSLTKKYSLNEILSTLLAMHIMPKREDFQRMVLYSMGKHHLANHLDSRGEVFPVDESIDPIMPADVCPLRMNSCMAKEYAHWIPERSLTKPLVIIRVMKKIAEGKEVITPPKGGSPSGISNPGYSTMVFANTSGLVRGEEAGNKVKRALLGRRAGNANIPTQQEELGIIPKHAEEQIMPAPQSEKKPALKNPFFAITGLGALYIGYQRLMNMGNSSNLPKMERTMINNPWMLPLLAGAAGLAAVSMQPKTAGYVEGGIKRFKDPGMLKSILAATIPAYMYSGRQEYKAQRGEQLDTVQEFVRKHPFVTSLAALGVVRGGVKAFTKRATAEDVVAEMPMEMINSIYEKIIS